MRLRERPTRLVLAMVALLVVASACGNQSNDRALTLDPDDPALGASLDEYFDERAEGEQPASVFDSQPESSNSSTPPPGFAEIQWEDLVPIGSSDAEISALFDDRIAAEEPGSEAVNAIYEEMQAEFNNQPVNPEMSGKTVQLAGFVAPLTYDGDLVTEFLLVPYFGACIHVPPPPPNQTVMVTLPEGEGLTMEESWGAVWVTGTLTVDGAETDLATAGYSITDAQSGPYDGY